MRRECSVSLIRRVALSRGRRNYQNTSRRELRSALYCREQTLTLLLNRQMRPQSTSRAAIEQTIEQSQLIFQSSGYNFSETDIMIREGRFVMKMRREGNHPGPEVHFNLTGYSSIVLGVAKTIYGDMDGQVQCVVSPEPRHTPFSHQSISTFELANNFNLLQSTLVLMTGETDCGSHNFSGQMRPNADIEVEVCATRLRGDNVQSMQLPMETNVENGSRSPDVALLSSLLDLRHGANFQFCCYEPQIPEKQKKQTEQSPKSAARLEDGVRLQDVQLSPSTLVDTCEVVCAIAQEVMGTIIDANAPLMSAGLDSLSAVDFVSTLATKLELEIAPTALFDHPTINSLASFLSSELASTTAKTQTECQEAGREVESIV